MKFKVSYSQPDLSARGTKKALRAGLDKALHSHRVKYLPLHFKAIARTRYSSAYRESAKAEHSGRFAAKIKAMSNEQRKAFFEERKRQRAQPGQFSRRLPKSQRLLPLVDKGRLRDAVQNNPAKTMGNINTRSIQISGLPWYLIVQHDGSMDKVKALQAVHPDEEAAFAKIVDFEFNKYLNSKGKSHG